MSTRTTEPTHRCIRCRSILRNSDHILAFVAEDLEGFVEERSQLGKDRAATYATTFVMLDLRLRDAHPVHPPVSDLVLVLLKLSFGILINAHEECAPSHARERRWPVGFEIKVNSRASVMRVVLWYVKRMAEYRINVIGLGFGYHGSVLQFTGVRASYPF